MNSKKNEEILSAQGNSCDRGKASCREWQLDFPVTDRERFQGPFQQVEANRMAVPWDRDVDWPRLAGSFPETQQIPAAVGRFRSGGNGSRRIDCYAWCDSEGGAVPNVPC